MADLEHLWPPFRAKVEALLADPDAKKLGVYVVSAFRSVDLQAALYADAVKKYGKAGAGKWVAPPGHSNHGPKLDAFGHEPGQYGRAVDFGVPGAPAVSGKWPARTKAAMDRLGARYQMHSPMTWEDWHFEPSPSLYLQAVVLPVKQRPVQPTWEYQEAEVRTTLVMVGPLDKQGRGFEDWNPGLSRDPVIVGTVKQGPDPSAGSPDDQADDPYWEKQGAYDVKASPRGGVARVVVTGGVPGATVGVYVSVA